MAWRDRGYADEGEYRSSLGFTLPGRMTLYVMGACFLMFVLQSLTATAAVTGWGGLIFSEGRAFTQPWRWITYQYLHGGALHIFFNLLGIYFFLMPLETLWGWRKALAFYTLGGLMAGVTCGIIGLFVDYPVFLIGASGSILACLGACAVLFPEKQVLLLVIPVPIRLLAVLLGVFYLLSVIGHRDLSDAAHIGGLIFGVIATVYGRAMLRSAEGTVQRFQETRERQAEVRDEEIIDRILAKVSEKGMHSLSEREKKALKQATEAQRQRESRRPGHRAW